VFLSLLRLGATAFGGPAMIPYIRDLAVRKRRWVSDESFRDGVALCQSIPGATAMQMAGYVGLRARGPVGALAAFVGFGLPAFVFMLALSAAYQRTHELGPVLSAFRGLQVIVVALMVNGTLTFARSSIRGWRDVIPAAGAAAALWMRVSPILVIAAAAALGLVLYARMDLPGPLGRAGDGAAVRPWRFVAAVLVVLAGGLVGLFLTDRRLFELALLMLKVDLFAFGGGLASLPLMLHEVVGVRRWIDEKAFMDGIALGQVTPGPIVITATFVGWQVAGLPGAATATVCIFAPSLLMVVTAVRYFDRMQRSVLFRRALRGVLVSFVGLLVAVSVHFGMAASWTVASGVLALGAIVALMLRVDILWVVLVGGGISVLFL
jgi:chromate transporter